MALRPCAGDGKRHVVDGDATEASSRARALLMIASRYCRVRCVLQRQAGCCVKEDTSLFAGERQNGEPPGSQVSVRRSAAGVFRRAEERKTEDLEAPYLSGKEASGQGQGLG